MWGSSRSLPRARRQEGVACLPRLLGQPVPDAVLLYGPVRPQPGKDGLRPIIPEKTHAQNLVSDKFANYLESGVEPKRNCLRSCKWFNGVMLTSDRFTRV